MKPDNLNCRPDNRIGTVVSRYQVVTQICFRFMQDNLWSQSLRDCYKKKYFFIVSLKGKTGIFTLHLHGTDKSTVFIITNTFSITGKLGNSFISLNHYASCITNVVSLGNWKVRVNKFMSVRPLF